METKKSLEKFDLVVPAKDLLDAVIVSADSYSKKPMTEERHKNMKLTLGFLNAYLKSFHTKMGYFRLTDVGRKVKAVERLSKKRFRK